MGADEDESPNSNDADNLLTKGRNPIGKHDNSSAAATSNQMHRNGADVVVNAAGLLKGRDLQRIHVDMPRALIAANPPYAASTWNQRSSLAQRSAMVASGAIAPELVVPAVAATA